MKERIQNPIMNRAKSPAFERLLCFLFSAGMCACGGSVSMEESSAQPNKISQETHPDMQVSAPSSVQPDPSQSAEPSIPPSDTETEEVVSQSFSMRIREEPYETFVEVASEESDAVKVLWRRKSKRMSIRWDAKQELEGQVQMLQQMTAFLHEKEGNDVLSGAFALTIDWYNYPAYVERLARFAAIDPEWQKNKLSGKKGEPSTQHLHKYIVDVTNAQHLVEELNQIVTPLNATLQLQFVEKCSTIRPGEKNEIGKGLQALNIQSKKNLPVGCLWASFEIVPSPE